MDVGMMFVVVWVLSVGGLLDNLMVVMDSVYRVVIFEVREGVCDVIVWVYDDSMV